MTAQSSVILAVEDEPMMLSSIVTTLLRAGYTVFSALDGAQAIRISDRYVDKIDLLVVDYVMPGMSGATMVALIKENRPNVKVLYVSGYPFIKEDVVGECLLKPFSPEELLDKIKEVLSK